MEVSYEAYYDAVMSELNRTLRTQSKIMDPYAVHRAFEQALARLGLPSPQRDQVRATLEAEPHHLRAVFPYDSRAALLYPGIPEAHQGALRLAP